ncbi:uncharacterized protein LOC129919498 [Episyrphus balteatus]|uniref:uncharacterized protein LOC129919498 n=1 Tax=Episyrphus balteatus TaxID=286459 RepID=UPI0024869294|nr:uncharacterized protein LOC129919498 [Episyrphus balteatus]
MSYLLFLIFFAILDIGRTYSLETFKPSNEKLSSLLIDIHKVESFQSLFILKSSKKLKTIDNEENFIKDLSISLEIPIIQSTETASFHLKKKINENLLTFVFFDSKNQLLLQQLSKYLNHLRFCKIIFYYSNNSLKKETELIDLFDFCWRNSMINVMVIYSDFANSSIYYSYSNFSNVPIEEIIWNGSLPNHGYFPNRMRDLKRTVLPVLLGGDEPGMIFKRNSIGVEKVLGHSGHFFRALAKKHNGVLNMTNINPSLTNFDMFQLVLKGTVEFSSGVVQRTEQLEMYTYPYYLVDWCIMLPVEPKISISDIFIRIFDCQTFLLTIAALFLLSVILEYISGQKTALIDYFFNDKCLRGFLGQPFPEVSNASGCHF